MQEEIRRESKLHLKNHATSHNGSNGGYEG